MTTSTERAVLAGGCFWGMQDLFRRLRPPPHKEFDWSYWAVPIKASLIGTASHAECDRPRL